MTLRAATVVHPLTITQPMVLIPAETYRLLLAEAGYLPTPQLNRDIAQARARFRQGRAIPWEQLKRALLK